MLILLRLLDSVVRVKLADSAMCGWQGMCASSFVNGLHQDGG